MKVYTGFVQGHHGLIFVPGVLPEEELHNDPSWSLEELPGASVHRMLCADEETWDPESDVPGSVFSIRYACDNPLHEHYGETKYAVVVQGEMQWSDLPDPDAASLYIEAMKKMHAAMVEVVV